MRQSETRATIAAAIVLVVGTGFGRFAFTGLYPLMVADQQMPPPPTMPTIWSAHFSPLCFRGYRTEDCARSPW